MQENNLNSHENMITELHTSSWKFCVQFLGSMFMDRLYSQTMQPWVMAEVRRNKKYTQVVFEVVGETICVSSMDASQEAKALLFEHHLKGVTCFAKLHQDKKCFAYLTQYQLSDDFVCHVYLADSEEVVPQIFQALREASKDITRKSSSGETTGQSPLDSSRAVTDGGDGDSSKSLFEVKYVGRAKVGGKKVTSDDIDNLADKMVMKLEEREQERMKQKDQNNCGFQAEERSRSRHESEASVQSLPDTLEDFIDDLATENKLQKQVLKKASHSEPNIDVLSPVILNEDIDSDGSVRYGIQATYDTLLGGVADSKYQTDQTVAQQMDFQSDSESSRDSLSTSLEQSLSNLPVGHGQLHQGLWFSSLAADVSQRRHSSQIETRGISELKSSFQEPLYNRQPQLSSGSQDTVSNVLREQEAGQVMVLQIGRQEIILISLDKKMAILECKFKDISSVSQGSHKQDTFGIVARESESRFVCHMLKSLSASVVAEIMSTLQMAFTTAYSRRESATPTQHQVCTACPLHQLHQLCQEIHTVSPQAAYHMVSKKVQLLPDKQLDQLNSYMQVEAPTSLEESTEVMMIFLRQLCERKQKDHYHILENSKTSRSEIPPTLVLEERQNVFGGLKNKAKKSFTKSFENLLSRGKKKKDDLRNSWTTDSEASWASRDSSSTSTPDISPMNKEFHHTFPSSPPPSQRPLRKRSVTLSSLNSQSELQHARRRDIKPASSMKTVTLPANNSPQFSESLSSSTVSIQHEKISSGVFSRRPSRSWRKTIFNRVCTPQHSGDQGDEVHSLGHLRNTEEIQAMWKKAFLETLILLRLEKETHNIRARQEEDGATLSRKLEYQELTPCLREITTVWEMILSVQEKEVEEEGMEEFVVEEETAVPHTELVEYVKQGVPRCLRGQIWLFLIRQHQMTCTELDSTCSSANYEDLLKQLTTHQHAILIDLGRTFPSHPYFSTSLGPGQLELFNLLKAYSLLDPEVGYCQGLSFIVGVLLMHMEEISAFHVFKYMMYDLGLRKQFRPNMMALQMKLYQFTRLLHDHYKDVYNHFEAHEISPTLYAAPWFLTLFASQFPLGFVARVFDMLFVQGVDTIFKVALMLIGSHRALILQCNSFETIVDFLKITLPEMVQVQMERIINQALELDIDKELQAFMVEYHVLSEEMMFSLPQQPNNHGHNQQGKVISSLADRASEVLHPRTDRRRMSIDLEMLYRLEHQNRILKHENTELLDKLQEAQSQRDSCELSLVTHQVERDKLRSHIQALELERAALLNAVSKLQKLAPPETLQDLCVSLPPALPTSTSNHHLGEVTDDKQSEVSQAGQVIAADVEAHESSGADQVATFSETPADTPAAGAAIDPAACLLTVANIIPATCPHKGQGELTSPALDVNSCEITTLLTSCGQDAQVMSGVIQDHVDISVSESIGSLSTLAPALSLVSAAPPSAVASVDDGSQILTSTAPCLSQADLHTSTTVSSSRQTYASRSISNVTNSLPAPATPEERRRSVRVIVQQSSTAKNL